ncbi:MULTISPECIES: hypothetical protein [unclassified Pseudonocardia]|uniref:hypothetical protein n=1 Tax=unclassified Pseudonocardia TaxID=2619320 RepID=UPI00143C2B96|nr:MULTISPECIES: hypothetical protein [unclassified Pseudonocardia]
MAGEPCPLSVALRGPGLVRGQHQREVGLVPGGRDQRQGVVGVPTQIGVDDDRGPGQRLRQLRSAQLRRGLGQ